MTRLLALILALSLLLPLAGEARAQADTNLNVYDAQFYGEGTWSGPVALTRGFDYPFVSFEIGTAGCAELGEDFQVPVALHVVATIEGVERDVVVREKMCGISYCTDGPRCSITPDWGRPEVQQLALDLQDSQADWILRVVVDPVSPGAPEGVVHEDDNEDWDIVDNVVDSDDPLATNSVATGWPYLWNTMPLPFAKVRFGAIAVAVDNPGLQQQSPTYYCISPGAVLHYQPAGDWTTTDLTLTSSLCGNLSAPQTTGYDLLVNSGQTAQFSTTGRLAGLPATVSARLDGSGLRVSNLKMTLPRGQGMHTGGETEGPGPRGTRLIDVNPPNTAVTHPSQLDVQLSSNYVWFTSEESPISIGGIYPKLRNDRIEFPNGATTHYRFDQNYHRFDPRKKDGSGPESNDIRFRDSTARSNIAVQNGGVSIAARLNSGSGRTSFPKGTLAWSDAYLTISNGRIASAVRVDELERPLSFTFSASTGCPECGGFGNGAKAPEVVTLDEEVPEVASDGHIFGKVGGIRPEWGPLKQRKDGEPAGNLFVFTRADDRALPATLYLPGFVLPGTDVASVSVATVLLGPVTVEQDEAVFHTIDEASAQKGNGFFPGVTVGPEIYRDVDGQPQVGAGVSLANTSMKIAIGGPSTKWETVPSSPATKLFARPAGYTGSFNFDAVPFQATTPPSAAFNVYGYPFDLSRFAFRVVANATDKNTWLDGHVSVGGQAAFGIPFKSLVLQCSGHLAGGIIDQAALTPQTLRAWNAKFDLVSFAFTAGSGQGECSDFARKLEAGGGVRVEAFGKSIDLAATWNPDGTPDGEAKLTNDSSVELDRPASGLNPDDTPRRGFDLSLATAKLESRAGCSGATPSPTDACGWFTFGAKVGVPFWNALDAKVRVTNVANGSGGFKAGPSIVMDPTFVASGWDTALLPDLVTQIKGAKDAGIEAVNNWVFDVSLPVRWGFGLGASDYPRFIADPLDERKTDLKVVKANAAADFITEHSTKISFGASADLKALQATTFALDIDLTNKESVAKIDGFINTIIPGLTGDARTPVATAVGFLQNPAGKLLKATGGGFDNFLKDGIRNVIEKPDLPIYQLTETLADVLGKVQRIPITLSESIFTALKEGIDSAITGLFASALGAPDQLARDLYRDLPTAWVNTAGAYNRVKAYVNGQGGEAWSTVRTAYGTARDVLEPFLKQVGTDAAAGLVDIIGKAKDGVELAIKAIGDARTLVLKLSEDVTGILTTARNGVKAVLEALDIEGNPNTPLSVLKCPTADDKRGDKNPLLKKINEIEDMVKSITTTLAGKALEKLGSTIGKPLGVNLESLKTADELFGKVAGALTRKLLGETNGDKGILPKIKAIICVKPVAQGGSETALVNRIKTMTAKIKALLEPIKLQLDYMLEEIPVNADNPNVKAPRIKVTVLQVKAALDELEGVDTPAEGDDRVTLRRLKGQLKTAAEEVRKIAELLRAFKSPELPLTPPVDEDLAALLKAFPDLPPEVDIDASEVRKRMNQIGRTVLEVVGLTDADLGSWAGWVGDANNITNPGPSFITKLPDAIRKPINKFIGVAQQAVGQQLAGALSSLPFPTGKQIREMLLQMILDSPFIEELDKLFNDGMAFFLGEINSASLQFLQQVNELIKAVVAKFNETANQLLQGAVSEVTDALGFSAAGITGYGVLTKDDIERIHLEANFSMNKTKDAKDSKPASTNGEQKAETETEFKAYLDAKSWAINGKAKGCNGELTGGSAPIDISIGAKNLPIKFGPGDGMSLKKLELGFTMAKDNDGIHPLGVFGGIETAGKMSFKAFELSDIAFVAGVGKLETYLGARARGNFQGTVVEVAFLAGKMCSLEALNTLDPQASKFIKAPEGGTFKGAYARAGATFPFINLGCLLQVGAVADVGIWVFADEQDNWSVGGLVGGGISGKAICLVSAKGKITLFGQYANDDFTFLGEGWVGGGLGFCEPEEWNTPADVANDGWCATATASIQARYESGDFKVSDPQFSGLD